MFEILSAGIVAFYATQYLSCAGSEERLRCWKVGQLTICIHRQDSNARKKIKCIACYSRLRTVAG